MKNFKAEDFSRLWGPYLPERQWGTVREDYSADGSSWAHVTHESSRSRAYRWGEDGLLGITDEECRLCFNFAFWNGRDPILKEKLFGLAGPEGNHGEDVKESYFYLDSLPDHSYMKAFYQYPFSEFPYQQLTDENNKRGRDAPEFELVDTGAFKNNRYFDLTIEYAKHSGRDILILLTIENKSDIPAELYALPTLWFRNTWSWGRAGDDYLDLKKPSISRNGSLQIKAEHPTLHSYQLTLLEDSKSDVRCLFTENETNCPKLFNAGAQDSQGNFRHFYKDAFHEYLIHGKSDAVNPAEIGTKAAFAVPLIVPAQGHRQIRLRLSADESPLSRPFDDILSEKRKDADEFYSKVIPASLTAEEQRVSRQAYAGLLWSKQFYYYSVKEWFEGDPAQPTPPQGFRNQRNKSWEHFYCKEVLSMPDKWEYPWFAAWDLAFHMIPLAKIDPEFSKSQLLLFLRERFMSPRGELPAYEYNFSDCNPPVHAWACLQVYQLHQKNSGQSELKDVQFLSQAFHKLLVNFTWWINRKEVEGTRLFSGGFLGLDNISVFDRSQPLPTGGELEQADATAWMAFYSLTMLTMALELSKESPTYEDMAVSFFDHFIAICDAMNAKGETGLWDEEDGFYYDQLSLNGNHIPLKVRSIVGLMPLIAVQIFEDEDLNHLPQFSERVRWVLEKRKDLEGKISFMNILEESKHGRRLLAMPSQKRLKKILRYLLDENEFLSPYGIRSVSKFHEKNPLIYPCDGKEYRVDYVPGESNNGLFGGNSNWRGPVWIPVNYLIIESLERYHQFYGDSLRVECPAGSGVMMNLGEIAAEVNQRITRLFLKNTEGVRPSDSLKNDLSRDDLILFHEYFHGENGRGLGASHQTGWTALITRCLEKIAEVRELGQIGSQLSN